MAGLVGAILLFVGLSLSFGLPEYRAFICFLTGVFGMGLLMYEIYLAQETRRLKAEVKRLTEKYVSKPKKACCDKPKV